MSASQTRTIDTSDIAVVTTRYDAATADIVVRGRIDTAPAAGMLRAVLDGHLRVGRRFLRLNLSRRVSLSSDAVHALHAIHKQLLGGGGTLIITGVGPDVEQMLVRSDPTLLLLPTTAADELRARIPLRHGARADHIGQRVTRLR